MAAFEPSDLSTWDGFVSAVTQLRAASASLKSSMPHAYIPGLMFRGQREASWGLDTTLERYRTTSTSLLHYYTSIWAAKSQIEAHTQQRWTIDTLESMRDKAFDSDAGFVLKGNPPAYDYMAYLRHHGFPSPLLDWTRSAYVAAFFAFREPGAPDGRVAIYAYRETSGVGKVGMVGAAGIDHGPAHWSFGSSPQCAVRGPMATLSTLQRRQASR